MVRQNRQRLRGAAVDAKVARPLGTSGRPERLHGLRWAPTGLAGETRGDALSKVQSVEQRMQIGRAHV